MTLPATLYDPAVERTHTPLVDPECRRLGVHQIAWDGSDLCCLETARLAAFITGSGENSGATPGPNPTPLLAPPVATTRAEPLP